MNSSVSLRPTVSSVHTGASVASASSPSDPTRPSGASDDGAAPTLRADAPAGTHAALIEPRTRPSSSARPCGVPPLAQMAFRTFEKAVVDLESALRTWELARDSGQTYAPALTVACLDHILAHLPEARASAAWERLRDDLVARTAMQIKARSHGRSDALDFWRGREAVLLAFLADMGIERVAKVLPMPTLQDAAYLDLPQIVDWYLRQPLWSEGSP